MNDTTLLAWMITFWSRETFTSSEILYRIPSFCCSVIVKREIAGRSIITGRQKLYDMKVVSGYAFLRTYFV